MIPSNCLIKIIKFNPQIAERSYWFLFFIVLEWLKRLDSAWERYLKILIYQGVQRRQRFSSFQCISFTVFDYTEQREQNILGKGGLRLAIKDKFF